MHILSGKFPRPMENNFQFPTFPSPTSAHPRGIGARRAACPGRPFNAGTGTTGDARLPFANPPTRALRASPGD